MQTNRASKHLFRIFKNRATLTPKESLQCNSSLGAVRLSSTATNVAEDSKPTAGAEKWQIVGAACITRMPIVCPPMAPIEEEFSKMLAKLEKEHSLKSDHELRHEEDLIRNELLKSSDAEDFNLEETTTQTALEYEDACVEELKSTAFASKVTEADEKGDFQSLYHTLHRSLVLVVKQKLGEDYQWIFPQSPWIPGETLRQTCERLVKEKCGSSLRVKILGNAPCGFYKYKYPKEIRNGGYVGAKVFFYKAQVRDVNGEVSPGSDISEHLWLPLDQLDSKFKTAYAKSVSQFLVSDQ